MYLLDREVQPPPPSLMHNNNINMLLIVTRLWDCVLIFLKYTTKVTKKLKEKNRLFKTVGLVRTKFDLYIVVGLSTTVRNKGLQGI